MGASHVVAACALILACACGTGDTRIDPGDLELRDLLGVAPEAAGHWDAVQREAARRVLTEALADSGENIGVPLTSGDTLDEQVAQSLATLDAQRFAAGDSALGFVRVTVAAERVVGATRRAPALRALVDGNVGAPAMQLELTETWRALPLVSHQVLAALASDAGASDGDRVVVVPAPRLTVIASYIASSPPRMLVNPVLLAAIDPGAATLTEANATTTASGERVGPRGAANDKPREPGVLAANPYSFYGSVAECAYAERSRCAACVAANNCVPITTTDGVSECNALDANGGRGYFLICVNLSLAITSVAECTANLRPGCSRDTNAASDINQLENNAAFLDDSQSCGSGLDACLAKIYGASKTTYPGLVDGGVDPVDPPRETNISCNDSCDGNKTSNCELSPNCSCDGPSCGNSLSCDSSCASSNNQSGCGDSCGSCSSGSGSSSSGGGCGGGSSSSSGGGCGGCGSGSSSSSSSSSDCGSGCGGGGCGGCGSGSNSTSSSGGCSSGGSGGSGCQVADKAPSAVFAVMLSLSWALLPVPLAAFLRRRSRKRKGEPKDEEAQS